MGLSEAADYSEIKCTTLCHILKSVSNENIYLMPVINGKAVTILRFLSVVSLLAFSLSIINAVVLGAGYSFMSSQPHFSSSVCNSWLFISYFQWLNLMGYFSILRCKCETFIQHVLYLKQWMSISRDQDWHNLHKIVNFFGGRFSLKT